MTRQSLRRNESGVNVPVNAAIAGYYALRPRRCRAQFHPRKYIAMAVRCICMAKCLDGPVWKEWHFLPFPVLVFHPSLSVSEQHQCRQTTGTQRHNARYICGTYSQSSRLTSKLGKIIVVNRPSHHLFSNTGLLAVWRYLNNKKKIAVSFAR
jgi:hypothetical protein